jgi:prevent-host-death family protein
MIRLSATEARAQFSDDLERAFNGERVVIERHGEVLGAIVSPDDLRILEQEAHRLRCLPRPGRLKLHGAPPGRNRAVSQRRESRIY